MTDTITLTGIVATEPKHLTTGEGLAITSFRLASSLSRFDRSTGKWIDVGTNWYTVSTFRRLAVSAAVSLSKGDRVVVTGRLRLRDWKSADKSGMTIEVDADALGHDLNWGTAVYTRTTTTSGSAATADADEDDGAALEDVAPSDADTASGEPVMVGAPGDTDVFPAAVASADDGTPETPF